jgi:hypothetical protein
MRWKRWSIMLDNPQDTSIIEFDVDDLENIMITDEDAEINELASMMAELGIDEEFDADAVLDALYAEHEEMMRAANSYDDDAISYGEMV